MKESNFNSNKWFDLGSSLRLSHSKLTEFENATYANDASRCLRECLTLWLQSTGKPLPQLLANALEDMEEAKSAEAISNIRMFIFLICVSHYYPASFFLVINPASQILLKHIHQNNLTLNDDIVMLLGTEGLMSKEVQQKMTRRGNLLVGEALRAVCVTVAEDKRNLKLLADVLLKSVETTTLGKELMEDYCKYRPFTFIKSNNSYCCFYEDYQFSNTKEQLQTDEVTSTTEHTYLSGIT